MLGLAIHRRQHTLANYDGDVYWNEDGTSSIDYLYTFVNDPSAPPIEFVDVGVPNENYDLNSVFADVDGQEVTNIEASPYVSPAVAVGLGLIPSNPEKLPRCASSSDG